jgi:hypothetical protein
MAIFWGLPRRLIGETGRLTHKPTFVMAVYHNGQMLAQGMCGTLAPPLSFSLDAVRGHDAPGSQDVLGLGY